jgi:glycerophosphoryl diester phosphodiesterase
MLVRAILFLIMSILSGSTMAQNNVVAHRGAWKMQKLPENSIASLMHAQKLQCYGTEFDVHQTSDGVLVVNHDPDFNGKVIAQTPFEQLKDLTLSNGEVMPTLELLLKAAKKSKSNIRLVCELKPVKNADLAQKIAQTTVELVKKLKLDKQVDYISFDYNIMLSLRKYNTKAHLQYLNGEKSPDQLKADGINGLDYHFSVFKKKPEWIDEAKKLGMSLNVWTVNTEADIRWFNEKKFDQITTNEPELALKIFKEMQN